MESIGTGANNDDCRTIAQGVASAKVVAAFSSIGVLSTYIT